MFKVLAVNIVTLFVVAVNCHAGWGDLLNKATEIANETAKGVSDVAQGSTTALYGKTDPIKLLEKHGFNTVSEFDGFWRSIPEYPGESIEPYEDEVFVGRVKALYEETKDLSSNSYLKDNAEQKNAGSALYPFNSTASSFLRDRDKAIEFHTQKKSEKENWLAEEDRRKQQEIAKFEKKKAEEGERDKVAAIEETRQNKIYKEELKLKQYERERKVNSLVIEWSNKGYEESLLRAKVHMFDEKNPEICKFVEFLNELTGKISIDDDGTIVRVDQTVKDELTYDKAKHLWGFQHSSDGELVYYRYLLNNKDYGFRGANDMFVVAMKSAGLL